MEYKVSILVPIYNAEKVLERCLKSVFEQTLEQIEYVFVNDCSKDNSLALCRQIIEQYPQRKEHVTLLSNEQNQGIAIVRQTLVDHAHGEYIYFVDSDDWIELDAAEAMYRKAKETNADVVGSNIYNYQHQVDTEMRFTYPENHDDCLNEFLRMNIKPVLWIFLLRRALFTDNNITFVRGINGVEDYLAGAKLLFHANKVAHIDKPVYHYNIGDNFYTKNPENYFRVMGTCISEVENYLRQHGDINNYQESLLQKKFIFKAKFLLENMTLDDKRYRDTFPEVDGYWRTFQTFTKKQNMLFWLAEHRCHWLFVILKKLM